MNANRAVVRLPYIPHPGQVPFHAAKAQTRVLACGRRWGKDRCSVAETITLIIRFYEERLNNPRYRSLIPLVHVWVVAPIVELTRQNWSEFVFFLGFLPKGSVTRTNETLRIIELFQGRVKIEFKSAEHPRTLVSVGLDVLLITEAGTINDAAWDESLAPTLVSPGRAGLAIVNGTPKGVGNFFHRLYMAGIDPSEPEVWAQGNSEHGMSSYDNPYQDKRRIDSMAARMPERLRAQEVYAHWLSDDGAVFRHVDELATGRTRKRERGHTYVVAADLAKHHDWTIIMVMDVETKEVVYYDRFNQLDWSVQKRRILDVAHEYGNAHIIIDSTNQDSILEDLYNKGADVEGYHFTAQSKKELLNNLILGFDNKRLHYPPIYQLIFELKTFAYRTTKARNLIMEAPVGEDYFDDCVITLALVYWAATQGESSVGEVVGVSAATPLDGDYLSVSGMLDQIKQQQYTARKEVLDQLRRNELRAGVIIDESEEEDDDTVPSMEGTAALTATPPASHGNWHMGFVERFLRR